MMSKYKFLFSEKHIDEGLFYNVYGQVCTRCFGSGLPSCCLIPMGDNLNHNSVSITNEVINIQEYLKCDKMTIDSKILHDYSTLLDSKGIDSLKRDLSTQTNQEVLAHSNIKSLCIRTTRECFGENHKQIWHDPYRHNINHDEDNDSSEDDITEDEDDFDDEDEQEQEVLPVMQTKTIRFKQFKQIEYKIFKEKLSERGKAYLERVNEVSKNLRIEYDSDDPENDADYRTNGSNAYLDEKFNWLKEGFV